MSSALKIHFTDLFIDNEFVKSLNDRTFKVHNPATNKVIAEVQEGSDADIDLAVKAADIAFQSRSDWRVHLSVVT